MVDDLLHFESGSTRFNASFVPRAPICLSVFFRLEGRSSSGVIKDLIERSLRGNPQCEIYKKVSLEALTPDNSVIIPKTRAPEKEKISNIISTANKILPLSIQKPRKEPTETLTTKYDINLVVVNCRSVKNKRAEVEHIFQDADVVMGTESWLTEDISDSEVFPPEYKIYRCDRRNRTGGGVFIAVKSHLQSAAHEIIDNEIESVWCTIGKLHTFYKQYADILQ